MSTPKDKKNILILGATGRLGLLVVKEALCHSFQTTLYIRNPEKIPQEINDNPNVTIIMGQLTSIKTLIPLLPTFSSIISSDP